MRASRDPLVRGGHRAGGHARLEPLLEAGAGDRCRGRVAEPRSNDGHLCLRAAGGGKLRATTRDGAAAVGVPNRHPEMHRAETVRSHGTPHRCYRVGVRMDRRALLKTGSAALVGFGLAGCGASRRRSGGDGPRSARPCASCRHESRGIASSGPRSACGRTAMAASSCAPTRSTTRRSSTTTAMAGPGCRSRGAAASWSPTSPGRRAWAASRCWAAVRRACARRSSCSGGATTSRSTPRRCRPIPRRTCPGRATRPRPR